MATIITNYTTYDLDYYYADLKRLPRQTDEERRQLIASLAAAQEQPLAPPQAISVKQRLIEGYLGFATRVVIDHCPRRCPDLFADLVQEANVALIQATDHFDFTGGGNFTAYSAAWMHGKIKRALSDDHLIKVDYPTRERARQAGTLDEVYALQDPLSLDRLLDEDDPDSSLLDSLEVPSQAATPPHDPHQRAQVDTLLSYLSPRAEAILRLRYGLFDDDERPHTTGEIARELGISLNMVRTTEHDALQRLRALVAGEATIIQRKGKLCISLPGCRTPAVTPERQAVLMQACHRLQTQGVPITARLLTEETGIPRSVAAVFVHQQRGEQRRSAQADRAARLLRLEEAYAQLEAAGKPPGSRALARRAEVARATAIKFLRTRPEQQAVPCDAQPTGTRVREACHV
jgi:RNA polymerase primary sigma factor